MPQPIATFTFAEIVVGAPWTARLLGHRLGNDNGEMLQCNKPSDEGWASSIRPSDIPALEREARQLRATTLSGALTRALRRLATAFRAARAPA